MKKRYMLEFTEQDGMLKTKGECDGFNAFELLGLITFKQHDIERQISGEIKPDIVHRTYISDHDAMIQEREK